MDAVRSNLMLKLVDMTGRDYTTNSLCNYHTDWWNTDELGLGQWLLQKLPTDVQKGWGMFDNQFLVL